jgi:hypothetical protein
MCHVQNLVGLVNLLVLEVSLLGSVALLDDNIINLYPISSCLGTQ